MDPEIIKSALKSILSMFRGDLIIRQRLNMDLSRKSAPVISPEFKAV